MPRKIDKLADDLDDLSTAADELKDELKGDLNDAPHQTLEELRDGLDTASDLADELVDDEETQ